MRRGSVTHVISAALLTFGGLSPARAQQRSAYEELQTFSGVLSYVRVNYVDSADFSGLIRAAIDGVLRSLDPHSYFLRREDLEKLAAWEQGRLVTTGLLLEFQEGAVSVGAVVPESPASKAGILPGDRLVAMNDTSVAGQPLPRLQARLVGEKGSKVRLTLVRGSRLEPDTLVVTLKRSVVSVRSTFVVRMADSITGYVQLQDFKLGAGKDVHEALDRLRGAGARQIILDLRLNPGGLMAAAVDVASELLLRNTLVFRTQGRKIDTNRAFVTDRDGSFSNIPLIVLIDPGTASAAEALAACLQDHDRALILGRTSFGKALEQASFPLPSGDVVMLTIARVVSPSGRVIQRRYEGLGYEQYVSLAGRGGDSSDTARAFRTDHGRTVKGGGGVTPDITLPPGAAMPVWWSVAMDSGFASAVADSVAHSLAATPAERVRWVASSDRWRQSLLAPFLERVRDRLHVNAQPDSLQTERITLMLAARAADERWPPDGGQEVYVRNDPAIRLALTYFPRLPDLLAPPSR